MHNWLFYKWFLEYIKNQGNLTRALKILCCAPFFSQCINIFMAFDSTVLERSPQNIYQSPLPSLSSIFLPGVAENGSSLLVHSLT